MLELGDTEFYLAIPNLPERELTALSSQLFDDWERYVNTALSLEDYSLLLQVEEGSVKGITKIGATLGILYAAIGNYGDFISGLKTIGEQLEATSEFVTEHARDAFSCPEAMSTTRKRGGTIKPLQNLFNQVQKGALSPEEAAIRAEKLLGEDAHSSPGFLRALGTALHNCPRHHQQQDFGFASSEDAPFPILPRRKKSTTPPLPIPSQQLRIEVWRDSKKKKKNTKIFKS